MASTRVLRVQMESTQTGAMVCRQCVEGFRRSYARVDACRNPLGEQSAPRCGRFREGMIEIEDDMPLRDHFRSPLDDVHSWDELHGMWPAMIVRALAEIVPEPYFAAPGVHLGTLYKIDVGTYGDTGLQAEGDQSQQQGSVALAAYAPPKPTFTVEPRLPKQDVYEVRVYDSRRKRRPLRSSAHRTRTAPKLAACFCQRSPPCWNTRSACPSSTS